MAQDDDKQRSKRDRIERLRRRLDDVDPQANQALRQLVGVLKGILDLLADEQ